MGIKQKRHFEKVGSITAARDIACIGAMIADLTRTVDVLDCDVSTEEERSLIKDSSDARYPILASRHAARRDNLKATIVALEARLSSIALSLPAELVAPQPDSREL